jgi:hypothetical protein
MLKKEPKTPSMSDVSEHSSTDDEQGKSLRFSVRLPLVVQQQHVAPRETTYTFSPDQDSGCADSLASNPVFLGREAESGECLETLDSVSDKVTLRLVLVEDDSTPLVAPVSFHLHNNLCTNKEVFFN